MDQIADEPPAPLTGPATSIDIERLVIAASRTAVTTMAPEELVVFDAVVTQWRGRVNRNGWAAPGGAVGFGIEAALVTELVIQVAGVAIGEVFSAAASHARSRWRRWRRPKDGSPPATSLPVPVPVPVPVPSSLDVETRLRQATERHAIALGLSAGQAGLLADAIVGALRAAGHPATADPRIGATGGEPTADGTAPVGDPS